MKEEDVKKVEQELTEEELEGAAGGRPLETNRKVEVVP